jgi:Fic family protein
MEIRDVHVWKPIGFTEEWERCSTVRLDAILPSWTRKRQTLKEDSREYKVFMERLKRQHAIETGIVEKLYDLSEGVTETFIKEGFVESYLQHGDTNIPPGQLMAYLQDNFDAIDFVFDVVKNDRPITISFIKELHQLIAKHQHTAEGRDQFGTRLQIPLLKGAFKERENNPTRADGTRFIYCPPVHVAAEMDRLIEILDDLEKRQVKPLLMATWLHHAFVQIHPFQDGNGRLARLLASLVLVKNELFPLTVKRHDKKRYIDALEMADQEQPQELVDYFGEIQRRNIEAALNMNLELELSTTSLADVADIFAQKIENEIQRQKFEEDRKEKIWSIFNFCESALKEIKSDLEKRVNGNAKFSIINWWPNEGQRGHPFQSDFEIYAKKFDYFYNINLAGAGLILTINFLENKKYRLICSIHHFGYDNSTIAIAAILEHSISNKSNDKLITRSLIEIAPFTISIETDILTIEGYFDNINVYLKNIVTLALAQIASELN